MVSCGNPGNTFTIYDVTEFLSENRSSLAHRQHDQNYVLKQLTAHIETEKDWAILYHTNSPSIAIYHLLMLQQLRSVIIDGYNDEDELVVRSCLKLYVYGRIRTTRDTSTSPSSAYIIRRLNSHHQCDIA